MHTTIRHTLSCSLPQSATEDMFLASVARKTQAYPIEVSQEKLGDRQFRLRLSGVESWVKSFRESMQEEVGSWGGRALVEPGVD